MHETQYIPYFYSQSKENPWLGEINDGLICTFV